MTAGYHALLRWSSSRRERRRTRRHRGRSLPMDKVYVCQPRTDVPQVFLREAGAGRVVYFPWDIDRAVPTILAHEVVAIDL